MPRSHAPRNALPAIGGSESANGTALFPGTRNGWRADKPISKAGQFKLLTTLREYWRWMRL